MNADDPDQSIVLIRVLRVNSRLLLIDKTVRTSRSLRAGRPRSHSPKIEKGFRSSEALKLVGTTGFEPATSRTPSVRATRLRHVPSSDLSMSRKAELSKRWSSRRGLLLGRGGGFVFCFEQRQDLSQFGSQLFQCLTVFGGTPVASTCS